MLLHYSPKFYLWHEVRKPESISSNTSTPTGFLRWMLPCRFQCGGGICPKWALLAFVLASSVCQDVVLHYPKQLGIYLCGKAASNMLLCKL